MEKFLNFFFSDIWIQIVIENEIYWYFLHFKSSIDTSRSRSTKIYHINLSYQFSLKKSFCFNLRKKRFSEASCCKFGPSFSFSNLDVSEIIS